MSAPAAAARRPPVAAIDCGTNSTRLLIHDGAGPLERHNTITRLGQDVDADRRLKPEALDRVAETLRRYRQVMDRHGVERVRMAATSAARDAANREELFAVAEELVGVRPELLSGEEEGRLSFAGATAELDASEGPFLVVDIGGGSTEFVVGREEPSGIWSVDLGCVRVTERFLRGDPPDAGELADALSVVRTHLDDVVREVPETREAARLVGLAGTVTTMAAVELGLQTYDRDRIHHFVLTRAAAEDVFRTLATEPREARRFNPGLEEARVDVIVGGALILVGILRYFDFDECLVSESDILDGLVMSLLAP
ncbi:MAG: exopolyphosphatase [Actinobacteria bacterium]|nr:exopolyphosphatase [Actinomycetota bacterium]